MKITIYKFLIILLLGFTVTLADAQITKLQDYSNTSSPLIGTYQGINFREAGFSGLYPIPGTNGKEFWTCSDRGVNVDCANANTASCRPTYDKMYAFPTYAPKIHRIRINGTQVQILQTITIKRPNGTGATGIINPTGLGSTALEIASTDTVTNCADFNLKTTPKDTFGIDPEGILVDKNGNFWLCDEGGATIWKLDANGVLLQRFTPYYNLPGLQSVDSPLDSCFKYRRNNRGFEGIAITPNGKIYAAIQSPMYYPSSSVGTTSRVHRIVEIDPMTNATRMFVYLNDGTIGASGSNQIRPQDWKIGDMSAINDSTFLVLDAAARGTSDFKRMYLININQATVVNSGLYGGTSTLEALADSAGLATYNIKAVKKTLVMDLLANSWPAALDKAEGLAIINDSTIAIGNDNDFGQTCPLANGIPIATNNVSHVITYSLSGANKLVNYKKPVPTLLSLGQTGVNSSQTPYLTASAPGVEFTSLLTVGDTANNGYKMVGIPDGTGAYDNGNGTFTLLVNHELGSTVGINRAHGAKGAFVSKWVINKSDLSVVSGSDLIQKVNLYTTGTGYTLYNPADTTSKKAFGRFCSADLPSVSAFYNALTGLGTQERIFMNGEESGIEGRAFGHIVTGTNAGTTYELPHLGKFSWENAVASPASADKTVVAGMDDGTDGQVYFYVGTKTNTGNEMDKAGLTNGRLYGIAVTGYSAESNTAIPASNTSFTMVDLGIVKDSTGLALNNRSNALSITKFFRPEDGAFDPSNPNDFYFVTTNNFTSPSRMWRLRFTDIKNPTTGGTITAVLDGTEGPKMMDNIGIDNLGHIMIQEDVGNQAHLGKTWQYTIANDQLKLVASHDSSRFIAGRPGFLTQDEEASGIIDVQDILGAGNFLLVDQAHYGLGTELVEGGQILKMFVPTNNYTLQVLHSSDMESSIDAVIDAPNFAAVMNKLEDTYANTVKLASGDCFIPSPFLSAGEDASVQTPLRNTASSYYSGSTAGLRAAIGRVDVSMMNIMGFQGSALGNHEFDLGTSEVNSIIGVDIRSNGADKRWIGAQFPYLSANLDFSGDANLSYLYTNKRLSVDSFKTSPTITANSQKKGLAPSSIIFVNGEKIGLVGATTQLLENISSPGFTKVVGSKTDNMPALAAILQPVIDSLRFVEGINKIIVMSHLQQLANEKALAPLLKGVDIIIAGGSHSLCADGNDRLRAGNVAADKYPIMTQNNDNEPLAILNTTSEWKYVGRFVANFTDAGVLIPSMLDSVINGAYAADTAMVTSLWGNYNSAFATGTKAANVRTLCAAIGNVIVAKDGNKFGKASVFLEGRRDFVRTQETNLGNVSSDANLWLAKKYDSQVMVSIKNGGGIRSAIGQVVSVGNGVQLLPTAANPTAGKNAGDISQLDIENSLRFNNKLSILSLNAAGLKRILEHGVSASRPGITPGQFPQVGGVMFSYDTTRATGSKIQSMVLVDSIGNRLDTIVRNGVVHGDTSRIIKVVTLDFLAGGGDSYPFVANGFNRINLDTAFKDSLYAKFQANGTEQDAFADYMYSKHNSNPYAIRDTSLLGDNRIQLLNARKDGIFPPPIPVISIAAARAIASDTVKVRGIITRAWGRFIYIQDGTGAIGVRQSSGAMVDSIVSGGLKAGDSVEVSGGRSEFNNYSQIAILTGAYRGNSVITKIMSNRPLPALQVLTVKQLLANPEAYESELIRIVNLRTSSTGNFAASSNHNVWDGSTTGDTTVLRIISAADTEIEDAPALAIPTGQFTFEGTLIQFCSSPTSGCTSGYQLQGVRKGDIIPQLGNFNLLNPANNARVNTDSANTSSIVVNWSKSSNAVNYKWMLTTETGMFTAPLLVLPANNLGTDTTLTLTSGAVDAILSSLGLNKGDSVKTKWTVFAYRNATDSSQANQIHNLTLGRNKPIVTLGTFNLNSPANNSSVTVEEGNTSLVNINWTKSANATRYKWFATTATGSFAAPLFTSNSNNAGADTVLSLPSGTIDLLLNSFGIKRGDSITIKWTVFAYLNNDSIKASQDWNVTLARKRILGSFNLTAPANNARVEVEQNSTTPIVISWSASAKANTYKWKAATLTGNFNAPLLNLASDLSGTDTKLTLTSGAIDAILASNSIAKGDSLTLLWTVFAYETTDSLKANETFNVKLVRKAGVGINDITFNSNINVYPNPTSNELNISTNNLSGNMNIKLYSVTGKLMINENVDASINNKIDVSNLQDGIYMLAIEGSKGQNTTVKVVIMH